MPLPHHTRGDLAAPNVSIDGRLAGRSSARTSSEALARTPAGPASTAIAMRRRPMRAAMLAVALACATLAAPRSAQAVEPLQQLDVVLLESGTLIDQRVDGGADALAAYLKRLGAAAGDAMRDNPQQIPAAGFIVVAVRPGAQTHAWFDFKPTLSDKTIAALTDVVAKVPPATVKSGEVVFALRVTLWGAKPLERYAPAPPEWREAAKQVDHKLDVDELVDRLWPR
jgi:hypothetical protein